jgi:hypothetical protein
LQVQQIIKQSKKKIARQSRKRASDQRETTEVDRIEVEIEKLREQLRQNEELRSMQESAYILVLTDQPVRTRSLVL